MEHIGTGYPSIDKPWLKYYTEKDLQYEIPDCSIYAYMRVCSRPYKDCIAIEYMGRRITYKKMYEKIEETAKALVCMGVKAGDIVSVCLPNIPEVVYIFYAVNKLGAAANMLDPRSSEAILQDALAEAGSELLVTLDAAAEKFRHVAGQTKLRRIVTVSPLNALPLPVQKVALCRDASLRVRFPKKSIFVCWNDFLRLARTCEKAPDTHRPGRNETAVIAYTGGTTGVPKGVVTTNRNLNAMVVMNARMGYHVRPGDRSLDIAPPWTYYGLSNSLNAYFCMGLCVILIPRLGAEELGDVIHKYKPNHIITVPSALRAVVDSPVLGKEDLHYIKTVIVGADKLDETFEAEVNAFLQARGSAALVTKGYGMTEVTAAATYTKDGCNEKGSVGIPYIANVVSAFAEGPDGFAECKAGEAGEIAISGPTMMKTYFGKAAAENESVIKRHRDGSVWIHTGDIGYVTADGIVFINGRLKRMFVKNGYKIFPGAVETAIMKQKEVESCAVVAVPDTQNGLTAKAYLVLKEPFAPKGQSAENALLESVRERIKQDLYDYELPDRFVICQSLPLTGMGKVDYRALERRG